MKIVFEGGEMEVALNREAYHLWASHSSPNHGSVCLSCGIADHVVKMATRIRPVVLDDLGSWRDLRPGECADCLEFIAQITSIRKVVPVYCLRWEVE